MQPAPQRILCIDNTASSNLAVYLLEQAGYEVVTTSSLAAAIELTRQKHFDLHLLNHKVLEGIEIESCDKLQRFVAQTPILLYSTVSYPYGPIQTIHCRSHNHTLKPINVCDVVEHVARLLKNDTGTADQSKSEGGETEANAVMETAMV